MPKSYIFLVFFFFYSVILLFFGKTGYQEIETLDDFFSGGRKMGIFACVSTFVATWFSAASMQGLSGAIYVFGYTFILYSVLPWFIGAFCLMLIAPKLRSSQAATIPEYFRLRYDSKVLQVAGGIIVVINFILYIVIQIRGFGLVVAEFLDISYQMSILLVYVFVLYTTFGGLFSISRSDGFNSIIIFIGVLVATAFILDRTGGIVQIHEKASLIEGYGIAGQGYYTQKGALLRPTAMGIMPKVSLISAFFGWGLGLASNPQYTVRIIAAKDDATAKAMIWKSMIILSIIYGGLILIGLGSRVLMGTVDSAVSIDQLFPYVFNTEFPVSISGIVLISIMAAAISTANSQLLVVSSSFVYDIFGTLSKKELSDDRLLFLSRAVILVSGSISLFLAVSPPESLIVYGGYVWGVFSVTFLIPLYGGMFVKTASKRGAMASMASGLAVMTYFMVTQSGSRALFEVNPSLYGVLASLGVFLAVNWIERKSAYEVDN